MNGFNGSATALLEDNGRLSLPKLFYKSIPDKERDELFLTTENELCILAYPRSNWDARMKKLSLQDQEEDQGILLKVRILQRSMRPVKVDKQGRLYIPHDMKQYVGIEREVEILGTTTRFEIWAPNKLDEYLRQG